MNKKQKITQLIKSSSFFYIFLFLVIILLFCILNPKTSSTLFSYKRNILINNFIHYTQGKGLIDPQEYWKFREFYSLGYFNFSRNGISQSLLSRAREETGINYNQKKVSLSFLIYSSPNLNSVDMLSQENDFKNLIDIKKINNIIFINKNSVIFKSDSNTIKIVFLLSSADMKKANGFFDYQDKDNMITKDKNWFNVTSVKLN